MSKTPLWLASSIGLVDPGYRGEVKARLYNISDIAGLLQRGRKLLQPVWLTGLPIIMSPVGRLDDTPRGDASFGAADAAACTPTDENVQTRTVKGATRFEAFENCHDPRLHSVFRRVTVNPRTGGTVADEDIFN